LRPHVDDHENGPWLTPATEVRSLRQKHETSLAGNGSGCRCFSQFSSRHRGSAVAKPIAHSCPNFTICLHTRRNRLETATRNKKRPEIQGVFGSAVV
ncbi:MAG TPA: hypothetical protein PK744_11445, partial [Pseudomonadales bacterium]|nr:hypothetical protein [Pseudomonadales bacterium]